MTCEERHLDQRVLRTLMRHGPQNEGKLAAKCRRGIFMESWRDCVLRLTTAGLMVARPTGHGHSRLLDLTEAGLSKASETKAQRNERAIKDILAGAE